MLKILCLQHIKHVYEDMWKTGNIKAEKYDSIKQLKPKQKQKQKQTKQNKTQTNK